MDVKGVDELQSTAVLSSIIVIADVSRTLCTSVPVPPTTTTTKKKSLVPAGSSKRETLFRGHLGWEVGGGGGRGAHTAQSFELKLYSFAHSSERATDWLLPLGPCGTAVARSEAGSGENWAFKNLCFPQGGLGAV